MPSPTQLGDPDVERLARRLRLIAAVLAVVVLALAILPHLRTTG